MRRESDTDNVRNAFRHNSLEQSQSDLSKFLELLQIKYCNVNRTGRREAHRHRLTKGRKDYWDPSPPRPDIALNESAVEHLRIHETT